MCKTWDINYACTHTFQFRLSTCRGTFSTRPKRGQQTKAACCSAPFLTFRSATQCGPCQRSEAERQLEDTIEAVRKRHPDMWPPSDGRAEAEARYARELFQLERRYPPERFEQRLRPEKGVSTTRLRNSRLRQEVRPQDVVEEWPTRGGDIVEGWAVEGSGWPSLSDEIAEREVEEAEEVRDGEIWMAEKMEKWKENDETENLNADAHAVAPINFTGVTQAPEPTEDKCVLLEVGSRHSSIHGSETAKSSTTSISASQQQSRLTEKRHGMFRGHNRAGSDWLEQLRCFCSSITVSS